MATCYLFINDFTSEHGLSLVLDESGQLAAPLKRRSIDEIKTLQQNNQTIIVLPADWVSFHEAELPLLSERKARIAIPYALEEFVAQPVDTLHFAFDRQFYQHNHYLVTVLDKKLLDQLIHQLAQSQIAFNKITVDWFALNQDEACIIEDDLLINSRDFKGAINCELAKDFLANQNIAIYQPVNTKSLPLSIETISINDSFHAWIAQRLFKHKPFDLCQGEFVQHQSVSKHKPWVKLAMVLAISWIVIIFSMKLIQLHILHDKIKKIDRQIAQIYNQFFPNSKQVISPKFRISQLLKQDKNTADNIWLLLERLSPSFDKSLITLQSLRYQNQAITLILNCRDFAILDKFESNLRQEQIKVQQVEAAMVDSHVVATLELRL